MTESGVVKNVGRVFLVTRCKPEFGMREKHFSYTQEVLGKITVSFSNREIFDWTNILQFTRYVSMISQICYQVIGYQPA